MAFLNERIKIFTLENPTCSENILNAHLCREKQTLRLVDALTKQICVRSKARLHFENAGQVIRTQKRCTGNLIQRDLVRIMPVYKFLCMHDRNGKVRTGRSLVRIDGKVGQNAGKSKRDLERGMVSRRDA